MWTCSPTFSHPKERRGKTPLKFLSLVIVKFCALAGVTRRLHISGDPVTRSQALGHQDRWVQNQTLSFKILYFFLILKLWIEGLRLRLRKDHFHWGRLKVSFWFLSQHITDHLYNWKWENCLVVWNVFFLNFSICFLRFVDNEKSIWL